MTIFTRLTFNDNHWVLPSGHPWKLEKQGLPNIAFENQFGYGNEEWLFNTRYHVGGYQYGYIRGLVNHRVHGNVLERVYLYTVKKVQGMRQVHYIGHLNDVELLGQDWRTVYPAVADMYDGYEPSVIQEIQEMNGDPAGLDAHEFRPVLRFRMDKASLPHVDDPLKINFPLGTYKRFKPYMLTPVMEEIFRRAHGKVR